MDLPKHLGVARAVLDVIERIGYAVEVDGGGGKVTMTATDRQTGETFTVGAPMVQSYEAFCQLAHMVGVDLEDG